MLYCEAVGTGTNLHQAVEHLTRTCKRRSVVFLISDFQDHGFETLLKVAARKHDMIPIVISDPREHEIPNVGLIRLTDSETGETVTLDTASKKNRELYREISLERAASRDAAFRRLKMMPLKLTTGADISEPLRRYFHLREVSR